MYVIIDKVLVGKVAAMYDYEDLKIGDHVEIIIPTKDGRIYTEKGAITYIIPNDQIPDEYTIRGVADGRLTITEYNTFVTLEEACLECSNADMIEESKEEHERAAIEDLYNDYDL
jgi:hypothetical protein